MSITLYEVGGAVRDELLGLRSKDIDFAVEAPSYADMRGYLMDEGFEIFLESEPYLTIRARFPKNHSQRAHVTADFVLCRKDGVYSDGRRPDTVEPGDIYDDLARRDFTVNAMARMLGGIVLIDPHGGLEHLTRRELVCVGSAYDRLHEDALRALRAVRFHVTKKFAFSAELEEALWSAWLPPLLASVSVERKREELLKCFHTDTPATFDLLSRMPAPFRESIFCDGLWLRPTLEK